jgi:tRNA nucleotidyltransferase (CCA-adding enzyme)
METSNAIPDPAVLRALTEDEPAVHRVLRAADGRPLYLVGGSVRDALLGTQGAGFDLDLALDGPVAELALELDPDARLHERFDTAAIQIDGRAIDIARTRSERYLQPGALPVVEPAPIEVDLARRDFTVNALAVRVDAPHGLIDPFGGRDDLRRGLLRVLHDNSFVDDPTRALRAARYCARLGFDLEARTATQLREAELSNVSPERIDSELRLIADEPDAVEALRLVSVWGLMPISEQRLALTAAALRLVGDPGWSEFSDRQGVVLATVRGPDPDELTDLLAAPGSPSAGVRIAGGHSDIELVLARAAGAGWLDQWRQEWRMVAVEINGDDLLRAGIPAGPAIGVGLGAALAAQLDYGPGSRASQLEVAVAAARKHLEGLGRR